jgi:hypothetical protein
VAAPLEDPVRDPDSGAVVSGVCDCDPFCEDGVCVRGVVASGDCEPLCELGVCCDAGGISGDGGCCVDGVCCDGVASGDEVDGVD